MNLEEWLEKMKEKPGTVWCKSEVHPPKQCHFCKKGLYTRGRGIYMQHFNNTVPYMCKACGEKMDRDVARAIEEAFLFEGPFLPKPIFNSKELESIILEEETKAREELHGYPSKREDILVLDSKGCLKGLHPNEPTKERRVEEALALLRKEFKEVKITL